jgi:hypothetical protein
MKHFIWRLAHNSLPLQHNVKIRRMKLDTISPMCHCLDEDGRYILIKCVHQISPLQKRWSQTRFNIHDSVNVPPSGPRWMTIEELHMCFIDCWTSSPKENHFVDDWAASSYLLFPASRYVTCTNNLKIRTRTDATLDTYKIHDSVTMGSTLAKLRMHIGQHLVHCDTLGKINNTMNGLIEWWY